ncbi:hypothetical protein BT1A1_2532 [Caldibacillus thermoamylovorans]|jgi:hypothetical protein|uniref:Uncharacterized protein n=1 Tax=Caldibacillus thermoamylovorans TaxID=35841 RepID=A0A090J3D4_9BACI|nr:hypothetical protein BT1A1_2532 [Caldibacillus thermoamylovorans]
MTQYNLTLNLQELTKFNKFSAMERKYINFNKYCGITTYPHLENFSD